MSVVVPTNGSLRRRLTLQLVGSAAVLATILFLTVLGIARTVATQTQDNTLSASLTAILESVSVQDADVSIDIPYAAFSMLGTVGDERVFYRVTVDGAFLTGYQDLPNASNVDSDGRGSLTAPYKGEDVRIVSASRLLSVDGQPVEVRGSLAQTRTGYTATLAAILQSAILIGLGFFTVAVLLAILTAQGTIRPIQNLAASVSRRGPNDLRPVVAPVPSEMISLVTSLNRFIERLSTTLTRSEDFIAEAAHRVRTPLATVRTQAEIALRRAKQPEDRASLKDMIRAIDESSRAAGQMLDHAMVTFRADQLDRAPVSIVALVEDIVERLRAVAELKDIELNVEHAEPVLVAVDSILVQNAIRNILDNAIKYSPEEQDVTVWIGKTNESAVVQVSDRGAGFPKQDTDRLLDRFARGDNVRTTVGSGLGLTIAKEVVEAHGGSITIGNNKNEVGACVTLFFPLA
ncbi:MAG: sensor histidine kinase [Paracoccaceae bacterium]